MGQSKVTKVLLIEDNREDILLIQEMLSETTDWFFDLKEANRLQDGLKIIAEDGVDVILLDLSLPDSKGLETFFKVRAQAKDMPILVMTVLDDEELAVRAVHEGAQDYLVKRRVDGHLLARSIRYAIERQRMLVELQEEREKLRKSLDKLQRVLEETIQAMVLTIEARDPYTAGHQKRVSDLACAIAGEMDLSKEQIEGIHMAGVIHDLGKISVPGEILNKPGLLSEIELKMVNFHAQISYDILKGIEFPWPVAKIILAHHERMNGSGYPGGLKGEEIMIEARILAVSDVVEAMSSHRPYRAALGIDAALEEISKNKGTLYDPEVVNACLILFLEKGFKLSDNTCDKIDRIWGGGVE